MKKGEFLVAVSLLAISALVVARNTIWHPAPEQIVVNMASPKADEDPSRAATMALLKKYSKRGASYVSPDAHVSDAPDGQVDNATPLFEPSPAPAPADPAKPATPTNPSTTAPGADTSPQAPNPDNIPSNGQDQSYSAPQASPPVAYDDYTRALSIAQLSDPWNLNDQQLLDGMVGALDQDQRNVFQNMWSTMTPDEQQQWLYELRGMLQP